MPKQPVDEDRIRRKAALEAKKQARKEAKAKEEDDRNRGDADAATTCADEQQQQQLQQQQPVADACGPQQKRCPIIHLPQVSIHTIYTMLSAADLGCLAGTCRRLHAELDRARIPFVLSRLFVPPLVHICTSQAQATALIASSLDVVVAGGATTNRSTTGRVATTAKQKSSTGNNNNNNTAPADGVSFAVGAVPDEPLEQMYKNNNAEASPPTATSIPSSTLINVGRSAAVATVTIGDRPIVLSKKEKDQAFKAFCETNQFPAYARFLEQAVAGYSTLANGNRQKKYPSSSSSSTATKLPTFVQGRFLSCSPEHSLVRCGGGGGGPGGSGVASWGIGNRGQLGHGKRQDERFPKRMIGLDRVRIVQVAAGGGLVRVAHSLLLTSTGRVLSFGTGQYGALGHGFSAAKQLPDYLRPTPIAALNGLTCIAVSAGELHSATLTADGDVYTWGDGFCGQLGHGDKRPQVTPVQVTTGGLDDECVANISCGSRHTLGITEDGECFSWGLGHFGVLGRSYTPFEYDADRALAQVQPAAPRDAAAELAAHLDLIANVSLDDASDQCVPKVIDSLQGRVKLVGTSAGHRHSLFLDEHGVVYSCGAGSGGALGHGDTQSQMLPCKITFLDNNSNIHNHNNSHPAVRIRQMSAGVDMSMAVSTTGDVYSWGKTDNGRIGLGMTIGSVNVPHPVPLADNVKAVDVECGYVHSMILGVDGTVHVCGNVGVDGDSDGLQLDGNDTGRPRLLQSMNVWHRLPAATDEPTVRAPPRKKYGKYEVKGRSNMLNKDK